MAVNAVTRNTKRILILNEELNEQRGMINALLNPRSYTLASADLSTSEASFKSECRRICALWLFKASGG